MVMKMIMKIKMILLHLDNHKNALEIFFRLFIKFEIIVFAFGKYKMFILRLKMYNKTHPCHAIGHQVLPTQPTIRKYLLIMIIIFSALESRTMMVLIIF